MSDKTPPVARRSRHTTVLVIAVAVTFILTSILSVLVLHAVGYRRTAAQQSTVALELPYTEENVQAIEKMIFYMKTVRDGFLEEKTEAELLDLMVSALPAALGDPYTYYLSPEDYEVYEQSMSGEYTGIGVVVHFTDDGEVVITEVLDGSPAEASGMLPGDRITHVDGERIGTYRNRDELAAAVRGPVGTEVEIGLFRPDTGADLTRMVTRARITNASLNYRMLEDGIGYIHIKEFSTGVAQEFLDAVEALAEAGADNYVLDLRFNLGGNADEVLRMLDFLLPEGRIAEVRGRSEGEDMVYTWDSEPGTGVPESTRYAILVNESSASASELFAGVLREYDKGVLIGEQTFGKGTGTMTIPYKDGSAINLSFFRYYLPVSGECIEGEGLEPDYPVILPEEYQYIAVTLIPEGEDAQLERGLDWLRGQP